MRNFFKFIRVEGFNTPPFRALKKGIKPRIQIPYKNNIPRLFRAGLLIALAGIIGFLMTACTKKADDGGSTADGAQASNEGRLTITGLDAYNGKYLYALTTSASIDTTGGVILTADSRDEESGNIILGKISGGSVTTKVWYAKYYSESDAIGAYTNYNVNGTVTFQIYILNEANGNFFEGVGFFTEMTTQPDGEATVIFKDGVASGVYEEIWYGGPQDSPPPYAPENWAQIDTDNIITSGELLITTGVTANREGRIAIAFASSEWFAATDTPFPTRRDYRINRIAYDYVNDSYAACGYQFSGQDSPPSGFMMAYSKNGVNYTKANCPLPDSTVPLGIAFGNGRFVMVSSDRIAVSTDGGVNWREVSNPFNDTGNTRTTFRSVTFEYVGRERLFCVVFQKWETAEWGGWVSRDSDISTMISPDGVEWATEY
jgi:hypothetical protein